MAYPVTKEGEGGVHVPYPTEKGKDDVLILTGIKLTKKQQQDFDKKHNPNISKGFPCPECDKLYEEALKDLK